MSKFAVVADSTAYIPAEYIKKHNIIVAPQVLIWDNETFRDGADIRSDEFFSRLKTAKTMPSIFQPLVDQGLEVLGIFISSKLSGTLQSAIQGREMMGSAGDKVTLVDSQSTAMALGLQVLAAARANDAGASLKGCAAMTEKAHERTGVFFAVDTLEFLHRGGRIGGAQRFVGAALT